MKDFTTRNTRGARKMADNGQRVPLWMGCYNGQDLLCFAALNRRTQLMVMYCLGKSNYRPVPLAGMAVQS